MQCVKSSCIDHETDDNCVFTQIKVCVCVCEQLD